MLDLDEIFFRFGPCDNKSDICMLGDHDNESFGKVKNPNFY